MENFIHLFSPPAILLGSCAALLMTPAPDERRAPGIVSASLAIILAVVLPLLGAAGKYACFAVMLTLGAYLAFRIYARYRVSYRVSGKSPRSLRMCCEARMFYSSLCLLCGCTDLCLYGEVPEWVLTLPAAALALPLAVRVVTGRTLFIPVRQPRRSEDAIKNSIDLTDEALRKVYEKASIYMEQKKPYLGGPLNETALSRMIGVSRTELSRAIRLSEHGNFSSFANSYRVADALYLMSRDPHLKVSQVGSLAGFQSESTFLQVFKNFKGMTPSAFMRHVRYRARD